METVAAVRDCSKFQAVVTLSRIPVGAPCQDPSRYLGLSMLLLYGIGVSCSTFEQRFLSSCLRVTETSDQKSRTKPRYAVYAERRTFHHAAANRIARSA